MYLTTWLQNKANINKKQKYSMENEYCKELLL